MERLTRREILRLAGLAGVGAVAIPILDACAAPSVSSGATTAPAATISATPSGPITGNLKVMAWNSATDQRQACIDEFMKEYPAIKAELVSYPSASWQQQLTAT